MTDRLLLDVKEVAEALHCGRSLVFELLAAGELPMMKLGRLTRIPKDALDAFIAERLEVTQNEASAIPWWARREGLR